MRHTCELVDRQIGRLFVPCDMGISVTAITSYRKGNTDGEVIDLPFRRFYSQLKFYGWVLV
jgi:hypothetical protein